MAELSPAAQAVLDAYKNADAYYDAIDGIYVGDTLGAAATLRAAADRTMDLIGDVCHPKYMEGIEAASDFLEHLAAELEALPNG
jgi:hypothetical protein